MSTWGYYVPYIILGIIVTSVGAGLLTTLDADTPTVNWAAYMVFNGLGIGMAQQLPYTALQAVLEPIDIATGNAIAVFSYQLGGALAIAIAQNLFLNTLVKSIPAHTTAISPQTVVSVGATGLVGLTRSAEVLRAVREAYAEAIRHALILALAGACGGFPFAWGMEWLNIKKVAEDRRKRNLDKGVEPKNKEGVERGRRNEGDVEKLEREN